MDADPDAVRVPIAKNNGRDAAIRIQEGQIAESARNRPSGWLASGTGGFSSKN